MIFGDFLNFLLGVKIEGIRKFKLYLSGPVLCGFFAGLTVIKPVLLHHITVLLGNKTVISPNKTVISRNITVLLRDKTKVIRKK